MKNLALLLISLCLTACVSSTYLAKQQYMLQAKHPLVKAAQPVNASLTIEPTLASPPYNNVQFIYRLKNSAYLTDYYNIFMTEPSTQITAALTNFLQESNVFKNVTSADMTLPADYTLKTQLTKLYADYTQDTRPKAVMEIQFILLKDNHIVFHTLLSAYAPLAHKSTTALIHAWNKDLTIISTKFSLKLMQQFTLKQANDTQPVNMASPTASAPNNTFLSLAPSTPLITTTTPSPKTKDTTTVTAPTNNDEHGFLRLY